MKFIKLKTFNMDKTTEQIIIDYLVIHKAKGKKGKWIAGGTVERIPSIHKPSTLGRIAREMEEYGILEKRKVQINGKGPHFVEYRLA